jgi:Ca2+/Na+ antiporter
MTKTSKRARRAFKTFFLGLFATIALLWGANHLIGVEWSALLHWLGISALTLGLVIFSAGLSVVTYKRFLKRQR